MRPPTAAPAAPSSAPAQEASGTSQASKGTKGKNVAEDGEGKAKKKLPIKQIGMVVGVLLVGYVVKGRVVKPHYGPLNPVPPGSIYDFPTSVTTNLPDGSLAQIGISLQLTKVGSTKTITKDNSELVGTAVKIIGERTYPVMLSVAGRVQLQAALLKAFQNELGMTEGAQQVSGVYFTSYVIQQQ